MNTLETKTKTPDQTKACPPERRGSGLIFAVVLLFVILGMVVTLASVTMLETKMNQKTKSSVGAFYNSESGVEWALNKLATSSGTISAAFALQSDHSVNCPAYFGTNTCKVFLLDQDGKVITDSTADLSLVKAVRSVGTQGGDTQRAIEAAAASSSGYSYTYYCYSVNDMRWGGTPLCVDAGGSQGYCPAGETQKKVLGAWGTCLCSGPNLIFAFLPPGGSCGTIGSCPSGGSVATVPSGNAYVCGK